MIKLTENEIAVFSSSVLFFFYLCIDAFLFLSLSLICFVTKATVIISMYNQDERRTLFCIVALVDYLVHISLTMSFRNFSRENQKLKAKKRTRRSTMKSVEWMTSYSIISIKISKGNIQEFLCLYSLIIKRWLFFH